MPPYTFDLLTRQELNEADLQKYEAELKKKNDAYEKGENFFLYKGRGPTSDALHIGHLILPS